MTVREILKMGDPRLLRVAQQITDFDTDALHHAGMEAVHRAVNRVTILVKAGIADLRPARHQAPQAGHRQAALPVLFFRIADGRDDRVDQHRGWHQRPVRVCLLYTSPSPRD